MGQTRMFRDRVVSMDQTLEGGEKHLALLKDICREALPDFELKEHALDHERDLFVMDFQGPDGAPKRIAWTRMVLYDAERIPALAGDPATVLRAKIVEYLRARVARPEIVVTFRHLEEGWVDTPEPRREGGGRRRRRGGRGGRGGERGAERGGAGPDRRPSRPQGGQGQGQGKGAGSGPGPGSSRGGPPDRRGESRQRTGAPSPRPAGSPPAGAAPAEAGPGGPAKRRRFRRRRRGGRGGGAGGAGGGSGSPGPAPSGSGPRP